MIKIKYQQSFESIRIRSQQMKQLFFEKGQKQQFSPNGQYLVETSSNLDSKKYILQKIPMEIFLKEANYIENHFYFNREDNLISYFNCWKQTQSVAVQKPVIKEKEKKRDKRTMLDVMRRKTMKEIEHSTAPSKTKKTFEQHPQIEYTMQDFVYVQMQYFSPIDTPVDFTSIRDVMSIIYLLACRVQSRTGRIPCMIPVKNEQNDRIKFFKKGLSLQAQLYRLTLYMMKQRQQMFLRQWSQSLYKSIHKAMINHDQHLVGSLIRIAIQEYVKQPMRIGLVKEEEKVCCLQTARIVDWGTLVLEEEGIQIPLEEYTVSYLLKSQNDRQITLTHELFEQYTLSGKKNNIIVKWLFNMAT